MLTYRTGAASRSGGKAIAGYLLESTIAPGAGEMAKYYYAGTASLSPEARHERELARAVAEGFLDFDDAVAALAQPAASGPRPRDLLHAMARVVSKGFIDPETAVDAIAGADAKAEPGAIHRPPDIGGRRRRSYRAGADAGCSRSQPAQPRHDVERGPDGCGSRRVARPETHRRQSPRETVPNMGVLTWPRKTGGGWNGMAGDDRTEQR